MENVCGLISSLTNKNKENKKLFSKLPIMDSLKNILDLKETPENVYNAI
jgi:hypothetical protein